MSKNTATVEEKIISIPKSFENLYGDFIEKIPYIFVALIVVLISILLARTIRKIARTAMAKTSTEGHIDILVAQLAYIGTLSIGIIIALTFMGVNLAALLTGLGLAGFAVGFAMKDILGNFLSGIILLTQRPFTIGDRIIIGDIEGIVSNIRIRDTQITTYDGRLVYIPNNTLSTSNIINLTAFPERRADIDIGISYDSDIEKAVNLCLTTVASIRGVVKEPAPEVLVMGFAESAITLQVRVWIDQENENYLQIKSDVHKIIKEAFDKAGVEIPFPIRTLRVHQAKSLESGVPSEVPGTN